jgi:hypothetical protein
MELKDVINLAFHECCERRRRGSMTVILLVTAVLFLGPMSIAAWNEPGEFRGLKLGQNLRDQA